jgi:hypothetical protein
LTRREELIQQVAAQMEAAKAQMLREMIEHALNCPDPVGCELRAWQALFTDEHRRMQ